jgi:hypothetical protein
VPLGRTLTLSLQPSAGCLAKTMSPGSTFLPPEAFQRRFAAAVALHCRTRRGVAERSLFLRGRFEMTPACLRQSSRAGSRARAGFPTLPICQRPTETEVTDCSIWLEDKRSTEAATAAPVHFRGDAGDRRPQVLAYSHGGGDDGARVSAAGYPLPRRKVPATLR